MNSKEYKNYCEAIDRADAEYPASPGLIKSMTSTTNSLQTKNDFRWFVLFNFVRSIDEKLNKSKEDVFLRRVQFNILEAAERFLK